MKRKYFPEMAIDVKSNLGLLFHNGSVGYSQVAPICTLVHTHLQQSQIQFCSVGAFVIWKEYSALSRNKV